MAKADANLAQENLAATPTDLLYNRFEALRCLAFVHYQRALSGQFETANGDGPTELDEAERFCDEAYDLVSPTESRVSQLWLGPLQIDVLVLQMKRRSDPALVEQKRKQAQDRLVEYQQLVGRCQSPRFSAEAVRLESLLSS